jgi:hypothetical protein
LSREVRYSCGHVSVLLAIGHVVNGRVVLCRLPEVGDLDYCTTCQRERRVVSTVDLERAGDEGNKIAGLAAKSRE